MYLHPVRKSIGLIILYSFIIVGIFVLQFRNESVISKNFGSLRISLAQTQDKTGATSLKNSLQVSFKGIVFIADEVSPAVLTTKSSNADGSFEKTTTKNLVLESYDQPTPLSVVFNFSDDVTVNFTVSDNSPTATLSVFAKIPSDATQLTMNFKPNSGYSVTDKANSRQIFSSKNLMYAFSAPKLSDELLTLTSKTPFATFATYDPSTIFTFASIDPDSTIALKSTYDRCMKEMKDVLVEKTAETFKLGTSQMNETSVVSYVAEMAARDKYAEAIDSVPDSFKKGSKRTYLSAPYFGALEAMQPSMTMKNENMREMIENAANMTELTQNSLNIFTVEDLADYIYIFGGTESVKKMLSLPSAIIGELSKNSEEENSALTIAQAVGILRTYMKLVDYKMNALSEYLVPTIDTCISTLEGSCALTDSSLVLTEKDAPISTLLALEAGSVLINYGTRSGITEQVTAGYAITSTAISQGNLDLMTISEVYPIIVGNRNYPHAVVLNRDKNIWTWTVAENISYTERGNEGTLTMKDKVGDMHFQIITNLPNFKSITIYNLSYRSDPRFEMYASSGYIYKKATKSLFLKTRHKSETEVVKFTF
ncbi:MAG: hypothetical protein IKO57_10740 [Treponema sp.]|nr:hypothetical protein [Treponema sp.]